MEAIGLPTDQQSWSLTKLMSSAPRTAAALAALFACFHLAAIPDATRYERPYTVIMGLTPDAVGNRLASATYSPDTSQHSPVGSTAEDLQITAAPAATL